MSYPLIYQKVYNEPWLIEPGAHRAICAALASHERAPRAERDNGDDRKPDEYVDFMGARRKIEYFQKLDSIGRIPIYGIIGKHLSMIEMICGGGVDLANAQKGLEQAMADPAIKNIVIDFNTPGGTVTGVPEFAAMIRRARAVKPVYGYCETMACSAGQWLISQCTMIVGTPSARFGSIGVYRAWLDATRANVEEGLDLELFEAGKHKAAGIRPLTDEERAIFQAEVEKIHAQFKAEVNLFRSVPDAACQGLVYSGTDAQANGLVDEFVECFTDLQELLCGEDDDAGE